MKSVCVLIAVGAMMPLLAVGAADDLIDPNLPKYEATSGVSGNIKSIGSDTMNNLMTLWGEEFRRFYPSVKVEVEGKGSSTAPPALIEGQASFGPMSRAMKSSEMDKFEAAKGYQPVAVRAAIDCLAVYVHKDCPLDEITIEQITEVFSVDGDDMTWGDLGVDDPEFKNRPVGLYGRNSASGTYGFFKKIGLQGNDYKASVKEQPGSSAVVQAITNDKFAIGYSGIGYKTAGVKALAVSYEGDEMVEASAESSYSGEYPLARFLYLYINADPRVGVSDPLRAEFLRLVFSKQGQEIVLKDGYFPVPSSIAREDLEMLKIEAGF
ncbi:MAG: phosphate ABC transporter substrate-binding protein [Phycisphaerales bacterium]|nr:phosphate ABC transporter substrate-binding protein [Phycisphaerales bacterium]